MNFDPHDMSHAWRWAIEDLIDNGNSVSPRGMPTKEILHRTVVVNMRKPVLNIPARKLSYRFMAAEAYWILSGDNDVKSIGKYNSQIGQFSDDGETFFGAYGPKIIAQLPYVIYALVKDCDTRQAGLTIWRESPPTTKDVPCTVSMFFNIRDSKLNCHVFMRSSDVWLGLPYDVFNFSMISHYICGFINYQSRSLVVPGDLYLTAMSSHLYTSNLDAAKECLTDVFPDQLETPQKLFTGHLRLMDYLRQLRDTKPGDSLRWWENTDAPNA